MKLIPLILTLLITACVSNNDQEDRLVDYRKDAERFCEVFSIETWNEMKQSGFQNDRLMNEFLRRIDVAVETQEFEKIVNGQPLQPSTADKIYQYYVKEVSQLTSQKYQCDHIRIYFEETLRYQ